MATRALQTSTLLPAEWAPQSGVMLVWPHTESDWAEDLHAAEVAFTEIALAIMRYELLLVVCYDQAQQQHVMQHLKKNGCIDNMRCVVARSNDTWARDFGPITVLQAKQPHLLNFSFNSWGGKYKSELDNAINHTLHHSGCFQVGMQDISLVLEGGSIESDGQGTLLTTRRCLLAPTRNPELQPAELEQKLKHLLGIKRILWLEHGMLLGDDTDSHIDNLARFLSTDTIAYLQCNNPDDIHHTTLQAMHAELKAFKTPADKPYTLIPLPMPTAIHDPDNNRRLPASYLNFLIINQAVLLPVYQTAEDQIAIDTLRKHFPERQIIPINCRPIIRQNGGIHCLTMQFPAGVLSANA